MKFYWIVALMALVVLAGAAVWMGALNQDEGWYLYSANLVAEGKAPYRDFFYTQGPLLPIVYSAFVGIWRSGGILGARLFTLAIGLVGVAFAVALAARRSAPGAKGAAALMTLLLVGTNIYHLYYVAIPKTYALASLFVLIGFFALSFVVSSAARGKTALSAAVAGTSLAFAAGTRISLGAILPVVGVALLVQAVRNRRWLPLVGFCIGGFGALALVYGPFLLDAGAREGLLAAQAYHAARGGFDPVWTVGSLSRLVRWYLPVFIVLGLGVARLVLRTAAVRAFDWTVLVAFCAVFAVQMLAPFPYEDYQVPVMGLLAVFAVVALNAPPADAEAPAFGRLAPLLVLGMAFATSFGSPLLEQWSTNGQDRFWSRKKSAYELAQLRDVARRIEALDPGGKDLLTQDLYLAIETNRRVPAGFEMGPFCFWGDAAPAGCERRSVMTDATMRALLDSAPCSVAALSGYSFAITVPRCDETPVGRQMDYWGILKRNYTLAFKEESFGQNATTLLVLKRK